MVTLKSPVNATLVAMKVKNNVVASDTGNLDDWLIAFSRIIEKSSKPICFAWLEKELGLEINNMELITLIAEKLNRDDTVLQNIRKSRKENLPEGSLLGQVTQDQLSMPSKTEAKHEGNVSIFSFTTVSPPQTMHDDVCVIALDKGTSLVIIPFYKIFHVNGAPCSVAILIDRVPFGHAGLLTTLLLSSLVELMIERH
ncbi:hypothetical protein REPUB_Repub01dG0110600 [Reevesia pubescens]